MSTSIFNVNLYIFTLFILLIIFVNNEQISANSIRRNNDYLSQSLIFDDDQSDSLSDEPINEKIISSNFWPRTYRSSYTPPISSTVLRFVPYKKRTIPLQLQRALYAHGIVGRRR